MKQIIPLVSIIVPVYNAEKFIHKCIDSIRTQTYENFELILVDEEFDYTIPQEERMKASKNRWKQIRFGLRLYAKYFCDLWW